MDESNAVNHYQQWELFYVVEMGYLSTTTCEGHYNMLFQAKRKSLDVDGGGRTTIDLSFR